MITSAEFHPNQCNLFAYSSSKGAIRLADMRASALCNNHAKIFDEQEPPGTKVQPQDANCHSEPATPLCFAQRFCATWSNHQLKRGADRQCSTR